MDFGRGNAMDSSHRAPDAVTARLGLWDAASIIVGIIIGVGIFEIPASIFNSVPGPWEAMGVWALGGLLALAGAFCFAELASTYPRSGGEYVYLTHSYGSLVGYLFAWAQLTVIRPGSIGALAYVFALYAGSLLDLANHGILLLAILAVVVLTAINILGVTLGATAQNLLTVVKVLGLLGIISVGMLWGSWDNLAVERQAVRPGWFALAMINILWTYAGWHEAAYIAAEVKDGRRNIPLALLLGTLAVTVIYLLVNAAYLLAMGLSGAERRIVAADLVALAWPEGGRQAISVLIVISALGAINGLILTTARLFAEFGVEHRVFRPLAHWSRSWGTPVRALVVQGAVAVVMIVGVALVRHVREAREGLDAMIAVTAAVFWSFFFLTGLSLVILRKKDADLPRPFRVPLYPVLPLIFCAWCGYMVFAAIQYKPWESLIGVGLLVAGLPFYFIPPKRRPVAAPRDLEPAGSGTGYRY
jgi:APA family basic amino acid/polyamine antiporter